LKAAEAPRKVVLVATGSEVSLAVDVAADLERHGIGADAISMPCAELFDEQDAPYRADLLPADCLRVSVEAGITLGWQKYVGDGLTIGIDSFGASGPADQLFRHFGFSVDAITSKIQAKLTA
jgi:transketolase